MKINQVWIEKAIVALQDQKIVIENEFAGEYKGYISSFGAAIIQSGLLPAVIFYENSPSSNKDKSKIINAIKQLLTEVAGRQITGDKFSDYIIQNRSEGTRILADVNKAAVALKLALRIFKEKRED